MRGIICPKCRTFKKDGEECSGCRAKYNKKYNDTRRNKTLQKFYLSKEWNIMRNKVLDYYCGVDVWRLGLEGKIVPCSRPIVHHIQPYENHPALALTFDNLICVSSSSHIAIHEYYNTNRYQMALNIINLGKERFKEIKNGYIYNFGESEEECT